jgi:hypothetical protein
MPITIAIPPKLEQRLRDEAARHGVSVEEYITQMLITSQPDASGPDIHSMTEDQLLQRVHLNILPADMEEYHRLIVLRKAERLSPADYEKLLSLTNRIEVAHAERMKYVAALARLRGIPLEKLIAELGIQKKGV